jgi:hypothetical protein
MKAEAGDVRKNPWEVAETIGGEYQDRGPGSFWPFSLLEDWRAEGEGAEMVEEIQDYKYGKSYPGETTWIKPDTGAEEIPKPDRAPMSMEDTIAALEARWDQEIEDGMEPGSGSDPFSFFDGIGILKKKDIRRRIELGWEEAKGPTTNTGIATVAQGGRIGYANGTPEIPEGFLEDLKRKNLHKKLEEYLRRKEEYERRKDLATTQEVAQGGRIGAEKGGIMPLLNLGGMEKDYRQDGGFVPIGRKEKADDVPARLSKNEFVFTADAVRAAGGGDIDQGAQRMYNVMKNLEAGGQISQQSQGKG